MTIGLTTKTFQSVLNAREVGYGELFAWAREYGFDFVEIRDFDGRMESGELQHISDVAVQNGLHPLLAWDGDDVLSRAGAQNWARHVSVAGRFPEPRYCRVTLAPRHVMNGGYPENVFRRLEQKLLGLAKTAAADGVLLALENSFEQLWPSNEEGVIGFAEAIDRLDSCRICLDPTNLIVNAAEPRGGIQAELQRFIGQYKSSIAYIHLKSSIAGSLQSELVAHDDVGIAMVVQSFYGEKPVCVELPDQPDFNTGGARARQAKRLIESFNRGETFG